MSDYTDENDETSEPGTSRRHEPSNARKAFAIAAAVALVMFAVIGGGLAWAFWSFSHQSGSTGISASPEPASPAGKIPPAESTETTAVPDVKSLQLADATERLNEAGFEVGAVTRVYVDGYAVGTVVSQAPEYKAAAAIGSAVALTVSKGGLSAELPRVIGLTVPQAKTALGAVGISVSSVQYVYDQKIKSGTVMSLAVNGTRQPQRGDSVSLTASKGLPPVAMPSLIGLSPSKASLACRAKGITLTFRPSGSTQGIVYSQSPSAGAAIVPGSSASAVVDQPPRASISARMTKFDTTWEKYNNQLGAHITCSSGSSDDRGITSLRWQVSGLDVSITGTGNDISFILPGYRRYGSTMVTLTVVDSSGQVSTARKIIKVNWDTGTLQ